MTVGGMDADIDDCMDAGGRATQDAKAERTRMYLQRVMSEGYPLHLLIESVTNLKWSGKAYVTQC